jgi:tripartite-type tricarboxylate transporter receptor subunit TctC
MGDEMFKLNRRKVLAGAGAALTAGAVIRPGTAWAAWPERPITLIVPWAAGGGTDATARYIGTLLEKELGKPVNVVNRTGGNGVVGHTAIAQAAPDGYTIGLATVEIAMLHWQGLTNLSFKDYTPLALMNFDPAAIQVSADSPFKTIKDLIADIKKNPGKHKASGTGQGGIWHLALSGMLSSLDIDPTSVTWVPSNGAAPGLQDLVAGGITIAACSLPEARSLIDAGRVKSLVVMDSEKSALFPNVPTLKAETGSDWGTGAWRGIVAPKGLPADITKKLNDALAKIVKDKQYTEPMGQRGFGVRYAGGADFQKFWEDSDKSMGVIMKKVGLAK